MSLQKKAYLMRDTKSRIIRFRRRNILERYNNKAQKKALDQKFKGQI